MRELVESRVVRAVVLLLAMGMGGFAGAPTVMLPARAGFSSPGGDGDDRGDGGGDDDDVDRPPPGPTGYADHDQAHRSDHVLVSVG